MKPLILFTVLFFSLKIFGQNSHRIYAQKINISTVNNTDCIIPDDAYLYLCATMAIGDDIESIENIFTSHLIIPHRLLYVGNIQKIKNFKPIKITQFLSANQIGFGDLYPMDFSDSFHIKYFGDIDKEVINDYKNNSLVLIDVKSIQISNDLAIFSVAWTPERYIVIREFKDFSPDKYIKIRSIEKIFISYLELKDGKWTNLLDLK